jgi:hypothetical protein
MSATTFSLQLARQSDGNWSLFPSATLIEHPLHPMPPMAFPAHLSLHDVQVHAQSMLETARVPAPDTLRWLPIGHTPDGSPAFRAMWRTEITAL